jgi:hypothetical protein
MSDQGWRITSPVGPELGIKTTGTTKCAKGQRLQLLERYTIHISHLVRKALCPYFGYDPSRMRCPLPMKREIEKGFL